MSETQPPVNVLRNTDVGVIHLNTGQSELQESHDMSQDNAVTPMSPSSKYSKSILSEIPSSVFSAVVLCQWDNILGPRVQHVWRIDGVKTPSSKLLSHITSQVLSCEICRDVFSFAVDYKFYNLPDKETLVPAFIFSARGLSGVAVHSLFLVIPRSELKLYLEIHEVLCCCFTRQATKLRVLMDRNKFSQTLDVFSAGLSDCLRFLSLTHTSSLAQIQLFSTAFCSEHVLERDFLGRCISSHLMTFGRSLVLGETEERINLVLYTLSLFNSISERRCSVSMPTDRQRPYHHDFFLQGMIKSKKHHDLPMTEILMSRYPTTVIDVSTREVKQTHSYTDHILHRFETQKNELICLQYGHYDPLVALHIELFPVSAYPETLVQDFMKEIYDLPDLCWVREAYITQFLRVLMKKAQCLLEYVETESCEGTQPLKPTVAKKMRLDLALNQEGDYRIILAAAEKLKPGIFTFLIGDRKMERDHMKKIEIL